MKRGLFLIPFFALLTLSCQTENRQEAGSDNANPPAEHETPPKLIDQLVGEWAIDSAGTNEQQANQRIVFTNEARYIMYSNQQKIDSGAYRMNEQLTNLYLESEMNEEPREYEVSISGNQMRLKPNQSQGQGQDQSAVYRRIGSGASPQR